ncbi:unnamed protein product [Lepeophtheirus salmonis]|uniref:(salmon louse) hypothetical protein n=1 Tax=Lepeophtheirus salmonis TaxID=72036 RepID=A0A7R8H880_LEPSM|nr:unnamed protein product [Lepeophtheirus salmonis]CAF2925285.1 unnamed protein product [Lepeophtheirus salmonis]
MKAFFSNLSMTRVHDFGVNMACTIQDNMTCFKLCKASHGENGLHLKGNLSHFDGCSDWEGQTKQYRNLKRTIRNRKMIESVKNYVEDGKEVSVEGTMLTFSLSYGF